MFLVLANLGSSYIHALGNISRRFLHSMNAMARATQKALFAPQPSAFQLSLSVRNAAVFNQKHFLWEEISNPKADENWYLTQCAAKALASKRSLPFNWMMEVPLEFDLGVLAFYSQARFKN
jgi:hypothetical protein